MIFKCKKTIILSILCIAFGKAATAQTSPINIVSTATPFLRISPDARSGGMGDAGIALSPDANATFWNSAKIPFATSNGQVGFTYTPWLKDIANDVFLATLGSYYKLDEDQALNFGFRYFSLGDIQLTDENGQLQGNSNPKEFSLELGYSRKLSEKFGIGLTARYINSSLAKGTQSDGTVYKAGNAFAADLSGYYNGLNEAGQGFTAGLTFSNLGTKISYTTDPDSKQFIPANMGLGGAYHIVLDQDSKLTFALDLNHLLVPKAPDDTVAANSQQYTDYYSTGVFESWGKSFSNSAFQESIGAEYAYNDQFFLRAGYHAESKASGDRNYFTAGVGIKYNVFDFNFSYIAPSGNSLNRNPLSNTLRFSLIFDLGAQKNY